MPPEVSKTWFQSNRPAKAKIEVSGFLGREEGGSALVLRKMRIDHIVRLIYHHT